MKSAERRLQSVTRSPLPEREDANAVVFDLLQPAKSAAVSDRGYTSGATECSML